MDILGTVSSKGEVTTTAALRTPNYCLKLCAMVDYLKEKYTFGYGITLGQAIWLKLFVCTHNLSL